jgi:Uma2 family endonuclease
MELQYLCMAATPIRLMTVEEFQKLPEDSGPFYHELRHGELVSVTRPKLKHTHIQKRPERLLEAAAGEAGTVVMEMSFRPLPEYELRVADVAYVSRHRWEQSDPEDNLAGAPELVIEVLSPSNTAAEIYDKEKLCVENGAQEFWVVDPDRCQVKVSTPDGRTTTYVSGEEIPLLLFGGAKLAIDAIFG